MGKIKNISKVIHIDELEVIKNKVSTIDENASDIQYPTAKVVKNVVDDLNSLVNFIKYNITTLYVPEDIKVVDKNFLSGYSNLKVLHLNKNVTTVDVDECFSLEKIIVDEDNQTFSSDENGILFTKSGQTLVRCPIASPIYSYTLSESVFYISDSAFANCSNLTSIELNENITSINNKVFYQCKKLDNITLPDSVTHIGDYAFAYCTNLKVVELGTKVNAIGDGAFEGCSIMQLIGLPRSVTIIGVDAFKGNGVTVFVYSGSYAHNYAISNGISYQYYP